MQMLMALWLIQQFIDFAVDELPAGTPLIVAKEEQFLGPSGRLQGGLGAEPFNKFPGRGYKHRPVCDIGQAFAQRRP